MTTLLLILIGIALAYLLIMVHEIRGRMLDLMMDEPDFDDWLDEWPEAHKIKSVDELKEKLNNKEDIKIINNMTYSDEIRQGKKL